MKNFDHSGSATVPAPTPHWSFYVARHTFATIMLTKGVSIVECF